MEATLRAFLNIFPEKMKKRTIWYLFDRYLGHFLREKLTLDQLSIDLIDGKGCINEIDLDVDSLNEELSFLPVKFVDGCFIEEISVYVPWSSLLTESCSLQIKGATVICQLDHELDGRNQMESDYLTRSIMSSSMQLAEEIVQTNQEEDKFEGLEIFAQLIDSVLRRVELIAIDTRFILRSKRKQPRNASTIKMNKGSDDYCDLEIRVAHLRCRENVKEEEEDEEKEKENVNMAPKRIRKKLDITDIEILLDGDTICTLKDTHVMEVNVKDSACAIQVHLASILTGILKKNQINELINIASPKESGQEYESFHRQGEKAMTALDYARIEQQLRMDSARFHLGSSRNNLLGGFAGESCSAWTSGGETFESCQTTAFMPIDYSNSRRNCETKDTKSFNCAIKLPGIAVCLVGSNYSGECKEINPKVMSLHEINCSLDEMITCYHLRLITVPIHINLDSSGWKINSGDIWIGERNQRGLCPLIWTEPRTLVSSGPENVHQKFGLPIKSSNGQDHNQDLSFSCIITNEKIEIGTKHLTNLIVDPTLLERIERYLPWISDGSGSSDRLSIGIVCPEIRSKLLIPVADLRDERPRESELRPFWIELDGNDLEVMINETSTDVTLSRLIVSIGDKLSGSKEIGRMSSEGSEAIRLSIKKGADTSRFVESRNVQDLLEAANMTESIFICTKAQATPETPFQVKTKIVRSEKKADAKTFVPNNLNNSRGYFETCKSFTQLQVELSADNVTMYFESKEQIDLLYNALGNDLALWTPNSDISIRSGGRECPPSTKYFPCGTGMSDSIESESSFHSIGGSSSNQHLHNLVTCLLRCDTLRVTIGDHLINSCNVFIGLTFGLEDDTCNVISIHGLGVCWSYNGEKVIDSNHLCQKASSLDLTFEIDKKNVPVSKSITVAIKLSEAILFKTWPEIFVDFWNLVNVTNEEVLGYTPPKIQTELHTSIVNGAIAYGSDNVPAPPRPVLITFDGITVTAMVVEDTSDTLLRFIIEEAAFYFKKNSLSSQCLSNYVCIIDSGLIDMSLKLCEANRIVFKAMNNMINVRSCSDSLAALCQLINNLINQTNETKGEDDPPSYSKAIGMRKGSNCELMKEVISKEAKRLSLNCPGKEGEKTEKGERNKKKEGNKKRKGRTKEEKEKEKDKEKEIDREKVEKSWNKQKERIMATIENPGPSTSSATGLKKGEMTDSGFWLLGDDDIGAGIKATDDPIVRILNHEPITIMEGFFTPGKQKEPSELLKSLVARYFLEEMTLCISVFGGRDFEDDQGGNDGGEDENPVDEKEKEKEKEKKKKRVNVDYDARNRSENKVRFVNDPENEDPIQVWESINLEKGSDLMEATSSRPVVGFSHCRKTNGGRLRKDDVCVQLQLTKVRLLFDKFNDSCNVSWRWSLNVKKVEIRDCLSVSNINKMLYEYISEDIPRRNESSMISIRAKTFRNPVDSHEECDLRVTLKPLRVNIDQDTIMFLFEYFSSLKSLLDSQTVPITPTSSGSNTPSPVFPVSERDFNVDTNVQTNDSEMNGLNSEDPLDSKPSSLFVKSFEFTSTVLIRLDYHGKRIDFDQGTIQGLLMGLGHLNHSELHLKKLHQKRGILGVDRVVQFALTEWFEDIKRNQIPRIIGSIGPLNSVRQLFQGVIDLFWIPVDQYRRDRRIFRGIQRGATSFSSSTATAMLDLANRLVHVIQGTAQFAHDVVLTHNRSPQHNIRGSVPTSQPRDLREGVASAYTVMREGLNETYRNVANVGAQSDGVTETVGVFIGTLPSNILHPIIKATEATSNVIVGMRNQLTPEARQDDQYKWKTRINNQQL